jgi:uncharacterized protein YcbX
MQLAALFIHPVKSCRAISVAHAWVERRGLRDDRRWMVADAQGKFITQRTRPELARVRVALAGDELHLASDGAPPLVLPRSYQDGPEVAVEVWSHRGGAIAHAEGSAWFSAFLGQPAQLVCLSDAPERQRLLRDDAADPGQPVSFADEYPFLLANESSLADLNVRSNFRTDVRRFRPNLVVAGAPAWAEDQWRHVRVGAVRFRLLKPCARCTIPTIDPDSGEIGKEPLRTLATFRARDHEVYFGVNAVAGDEGELRVGDAVELIEE